MQQDEHKTNAQLLVELRDLRQRNTELETMVSNLQETNTLLKESEERFRAIANYTIDWESWVGTDGKLMWVNPAVEKITGYSPEEYLNLPDRFKQIYGADDRVRARTVIENALIHQQSENDVDFQLRRKDGSLSWVSVSYQPMYAETGECLGMRSSIRDITKRKKVEEAQGKSEAQYRELVNNSKNAIVIYEAIDDGRDFIFKEFNQAAENIEQIKKEALIGKCLTEVFPGIKKFGLLEVLNRVWKTGEPENYPVSFYQDDRISGWRDNYAYKLPSGEIVVIYEDVTERKQQEEALRSSEERFRAIAESLPAAIITADSSGKILFWNKAAEIIYGYKAKEIVGKSIELLRPEGKRLVDRKNRDKFIKTGHSRYIGKTVEGQACKKNGTEFLCETSTAFWKVGVEIIFCGIVRDITERKRIEKALQQEKYFTDTVINSLPGVFYLLDEQGNFIRWNKLFQRITGYSATELQNLNAIAVIHEDDRALLAGKIKEVFANGQAEAEAKLLGKHGAVHHYFFTGRKIAINGQLYLAGVGVDIAERKRMEQELQKAHDELEKKVKQRTVELAKTNTELQASKDYLKKFAGRLLSVREEERNNISIALHDELGSMAISVDSPMSIAKDEVKADNRNAAIKAIEQAQAALRKAVVDLRKLAVNLRPPNLGIVGLAPALNDFFVNFKKHSTFKITFSNDLTKKKIPDDIAIVIYRVIQEALTNITKHAKAQNVSVRLYSDKIKMHLDIHDDGVGFDVNKVPKKKGKLKIGIQGMRERVESLGGEFQIKSSFKKGTQLKATLPK